MLTLTESKELWTRLRRLKSGAGDDRSALLDEVDAALERMARGTYGACEECDLDIPLERLRRFPYARSCIECQVAKNRALKREQFAKAEQLEARKPLTQPI